MYYATGRNIPQVNFTRDRLEYTCHKLKVETHKSMMDILLTYMAQMTGLTNEVFKRQVHDEHFVDLHGIYCPVIQMKR